MITNTRTLFGLGKVTKNIAENKENVLKLLNKCQASVNITKIEVDPRNLAPNLGSPSLYLLSQDKAGFQK